QRGLPGGDERLEVRAMDTGVREHLDDLDLALRGLRRHRRIDAAVVLAFVVERLGAGSDRGDQGEGGCGNANEHGRVSCDGVDDGPCPWAQVPGTVSADSASAGSASPASPASASASTAGAACAGAAAA